MTAKYFTHDLLPSKPETWQEFCKKSTTRMTRIKGPFVVQVDDENVVPCNDGWLALDTRGYPYPIAHSEHELIYEPVEAADARKSG